MKPRFGTLRARLLRRLWWPLLVVLLLSAVYEYGRALDRARDDQDLILSRIAIALASRLDVDEDDARGDDMGFHLSRTMAAMQRAYTTDRLRFMVRDSRLAVIGGDAALASLVDAGSREEPSYFDRQVQGEAMRVVSYPHDSPSGPVTVVVAETTHRRAEQARRVLLDTVPPNVLLIALALLLVRTGVRRAMVPLDRLSQSVATRSPEDLSALPTDRLPGELLPMVQSINRLMKNTRASVEAQQAFLSNAAHQLRTPLAGVQMQIELAVREASEAQKERLVQAHRALQRMGHMTHQMLALARSGPQAASADDFRPVDLQLLLEDAASIWLDAALAAGVDLGFQPQSARVLGSQWMLQELLGNLIHNAITHCRRDGRVTVRCGSDGGARVWLTVEDDGPGIPPEERTKVLERFYQVPGASHGGSGLGLAIVREVVLRHGGTVSMDSGPNGLGLTVRVELPKAI